MDRKVRIKLVILAVVLAGPDTTRAAALVGSTDSIDAAGAVRPLMSTSSSSWMRLEDGVAPELAAVTALDLDVQREVLRGADAGAGALDSDRQVCLKEKKCPAPGEPYTRPCAKIYNCRP